MATSDKDNARRAHQAEAARQIASGESVAFFATLLAVLNEVEAAPHPHHRDPKQEPADATPLPQHPETPAQDIAPPHGHNEKHAGAPDATPAETATTVHADSGQPDAPHAVEANADPTLAVEASPVQAPTSSTAVASFDDAPSHASPADHSATASTTTSSTTLDFGTTIHDIADTIKGLVDSSLATVTHVISDVSASIGQLTTSLTSTLGHLTDGLTGTVSNLLHDTPVVSAVEPLLGNLAGTSHADAAPDTQASVPLLDTSAAMPTSLFHPEPLHLGFLGQPTIDGHDMHDGAFSALGVHHF